MLSAYSVTFTLVEWLTLTGLAQCLLILVYIISRMRSVRQAILPILYFVTLACAFALQFSLRLIDFEQQIRFSLWFVWAMGTPISYLLILQVARIAELPEWREFWVLVLVPFAALLAFAIKGGTELCDGTGWCDRFFDWLYLLGTFASALCLLLLWGHKGLFSNMLTQKGGKERYWLVIALIIINLLVIGISFMNAANRVTPLETDLLRIAAGLTFVYLATTTLFRIYPPPLQLTTAASKKAEERELSPEDEKLAARITELMEYDKLYQEQSFSRADLARELEVSENLLSRVVNTAFDKSFPALLNEYRVKDAQRLLEETEIAIKTVAFEVGFNSLASFNRVFREQTGETPSSYRNKKQSVQN